MKIVLTGGTGFIGSNFINHALANGHQILAIRRENSNPRVFLKKEPVWLNKEINQINENELNGYQCVIHLAAHSANTPYDNIENCLKFNLIDSLNFLKKAQKAGIRKFIIAGSCFEYGKKGEEYEFIPPDSGLFPTQTYPASKAAFSLICTQWAIENSLDLSILRIFQVYGEGESESRFWPSIQKAAKSGNDFEMTQGSQIRDFIDVKKVAEEILKEAIDKNKFVSIRNIGSGLPKTLAQFAQEIWDKNNAKGKLILGSKDYREGEVFRYVPDIKKRFILKEND